MGIYMRIMGTDVPTNGIDMRIMGTYVPINGIDMRIMGTYIPINGIDMRIMGTDVPNMGTDEAASLVRFYHHLRCRRLLPRCALPARALHPVAIPRRHSLPERAKTFLGKVNIIGFCIGSCFFLVS
jgi:hypothetical protein